MKMSDIFDLPVEVCKGSLDCDEEYEAAELAINSHDELVRILKSINQCIEWGYSDSELVEEIKKYKGEIEIALSKVKG